MNEVAGGRRLLQALRERIEAGAAAVAVAAPQNLPAAGQIVDQDEIRDAAQSRVDVTQAVLSEFGVEAAGAVMDADPAAGARRRRARLPAPRDPGLVPGRNRFGLLRRDLVEWARRSSRSPMTHIPVRIEADAVNWDVIHTLVVATQTVDSPDLLAAQGRATERPHRYTIISPRSGDVAREEVCDRLARALAELYRAEIDATGQPMSPEPVAAVQNAIEHYRIDEILVSTLRGKQSKWIEDGLLGAIGEMTEDPVEHVSRGAVTSRPAAGRPLRVRGRPGRRQGSGEGLSHGKRFRTRLDHHHHGPPEAHQSSRVDRQTLGILLFIVSEVMLFGAFFASYFFLRVVANDGPWPPDQFELPVSVAGVNTAILVCSSLTVHWALEAVRRGKRLGLIAGLAATWLLGVTFLFIQINEYVHIGFSTRDGAFGSIFYGLTGLHGAHVFVGLLLLTFANIRAWRGHFGPEAKDHLGVEVPGIYWHFVDVMWIVVFTTVYIL